MPPALTDTAPTVLDDLFDTLDLEAAIAAGYVRTQTHPTLPYVIHNYAEITVFERAWTPVTRQCRGLITHAETGEVLARAFDKFFNHNEPNAYTAGPSDPVLVTDKADGSLGILYPTGGGEHAIATRGSFASEQAQHATALYQERYADQFTPAPDFTYLFEIIYPQNRIVVDYGGLDDLVLLGGRHISTGETIDADALPWPGPRIQSFPYRSLGEALAAEPRPGMEGLVVEFVTTGERVKIKQDEYVRLHRLVTGMNERVVWEHLGNGGSIDDLALPLPDEFQPWVRGVATRLLDEAEAVLDAAQATHDQIVADLPEGWTRKDYAMAAQSHPGVRPYLFLILDGRPTLAAIWKTLRPSGAVKMTSGGEDA